MRCPFHPACTADLEPVDPGTSSVTLTYPAHAIEGSNSWYGRCPASLMWVTRRGDVHQRESARLAEAWDLFTRRKIERVREDLAEQAERDRRADLRAVPDPPTPEEIEREAAEFDAFAERAARAIESRNRRRMYPEPDMPIARDGLDEETIRQILDDDSHRLHERGRPDVDIVLDEPTPRPDRRAGDPDDNVVPLRRREQVPPGVPLGRPAELPPSDYDPPDDYSTPTPSEAADFLAGGLSLGAGPDRPEAEYYPGRPADAPEPGPGERPAAYVPLDIDGRHLGRSAVDNARDQLLALLGITIEQLGQTQDTLAKATGIADSAEGLRMAAGSALASAEALVNTAVGGGTVPEPAERLRGHIAEAKTIVDEAGGMLAGIALLRDKVAEAHRAVGYAVQAAEEYRAVP